MPAAVTDLSYAKSGVDTTRAKKATNALVRVLSAVQTHRSALPTGHFANVVPVDDRVGIALSTDGVGTKSVVAEELDRYDTIGQDVIAMNVNDVICVGARPLALLDYIAVRDPEPAFLEELAVGLKDGADLAQIEIPGGEVAQLSDLLVDRSPRTFDLVGSCFGTVALDEIITGEKIAPGDVVVGLPASGVHANGLTLARRALPPLKEHIAAFGGLSVGEELLKPTEIYVRAVMDLLESDVDVHGLAHITSDGLLNTLRLHSTVGYEIDTPLPIPQVFQLIEQRVATEEMWEVFNMGCGFCCIVPAKDAAAAVTTLRSAYPAAQVIGHAVANDGQLDADGFVSLPHLGLIGTRDRGFWRQAESE